MQSLSLLRIKLLSVCAEILLVGTFCVLYPVAIWILVYRRRRGQRSSPNLWLTAIVTIMFSCAGAYLGLDLHYLLVAFVDRSMTPGGALAYFHGPGNDPSRYASAVIFAFLALLGDGFMAYRVFVVWDRKTISLVLPGLLFGADVVTTGLVGKALLRSGPATLDIVFVPGGRPPLTAYFVMTLLTNVGTTLLLFGRLWWHDRRTKRYLSQDVRGSASWRVMKTIMQCQAVYSVGLLFNLAAFLANSELVLVTNAILPALLGVSFTLIIIRIGLSEVLGSTPNDDSAVSNAIEFNDRGRAPSPIAVNVFISQTDDRSEEVAALGHTKSSAASTA